MRDILVENYKGEKTIWLQSFSVRNEGQYTYNRSLLFKFCPSANPVIHIWVLRAK